MEIMGNTARSANLWITLAFLTAGISAQVRADDPQPGTFELSPGVHIHAHDGRSHRSSAHYLELCRVVASEFDVRIDSISIQLVFIDQKTRDRMSANNRGRFRDEDWTGAYLAPSLILMLGEEEADDTFMHEFMHLLQHRGLLFAAAHPSSVHRIIEENEAMLLGSKTYLEYLKKRPK
jgi:hypothetical protein